MDILHSGRVEGFCIVSSDSDFTRLATRIREAGFFVIGMGRATTPQAFVNGCNVFTKIENLVGDAPPPDNPVEPVQSPQTPTSSGPQATSAPFQPLTPAGSHLPLEDALPILRKAYDLTAGEAGEAHLATLGATLLKLDPAFDSRTYGRAKLVYLIESFPSEFTVQRHPERGPGSVYVRLLDPNTSPES